MHRNNRIACSPIIFGALTALVVLPALSVALVQRSKPVVDGRLKAQLQMLGRNAKKLSMDQKDGLTSLASSNSGFKMPAGNAAGVFTSAAATDQASIIGYFAGEKLGIVRFGLPFLKNSFLGKQLRIVGSLYPDTGAEKLANDTATKIESEKFDEKDVNKDLDTLAGAIGMAYEKKGEAANFNFRAGSTMGIATVLAILYGQEDFEMQKQVKGAYTKIMENAKTLAAEPSGDLAEGLKGAFKTFSESSIKDQDTAFAAIKPVDDAYIAALQ